MLGHDGAWILMRSNVAGRCGGFENGNSSSVNALGPELTFVSREPENWSAQLIEWG